MSKGCPCPICGKPKPCYDEICYQCELKGLSKPDEKNSGQTRTRDS